jgi:hypothetical protein
MVAVAVIVRLLRLFDTKTSSEEEVVKPSTNHKMRGPEFNGPAEYLYAFMLGGSFARRYSQFPFF